MGSPLINIQNQMKKNKYITKIVNLNQIYYFCYTDKFYNSNHIFHNYNHNGIYVKERTYGRVIDKNYYSLYLRKFNKIR